MENNNNLPDHLFFKKPKTQIGQEDPFQFDQFNRKPEADFLLSAISKIQQPAVISISAPFGAGKSYFVKMLSQHLRNNAFKTVTFDAWEHDSSNDAFSSFTSIFLEHFGENKDRKSLAKAARKVAGSTAKIATTVALGATTKLLIGEKAAEKLSNINLSEDAIAAAVEKLGGEAFEAVQQNIRFKKKFQDELKNFIEKQNFKKIVIFIDELDRCKPEFAMDLLENIKHLFDIPGTVFILSTDTRQLANLVNVRYGSGERSQEYLRKFIDWEFNLPRPATVKYLKYLLDLSSFKESKNSIFPNEFESLASALAAASFHYDLKPRDLNQIITAGQMKAYEVPSISATSATFHELFRLFDSDLFKEWKSFVRYETHEINSLYKILNSIGKLNLTSLTFDDIGRPELILFYILCLSRKPIKNSRVTTLGPRSSRPIDTKKIENLLENDRRNLDHCLHPATQYENPNISFYIDKEIKMSFENSNQ